MRGFVHTIVDFLYPPICLVCGKLLSDRTGIVCPDCAGALRHFTPGDHGFEATRIRLRRDFEVDELVSLYEFEKHGPLQTLIHCLKYEKLERVGEWFGRELGTRCRDRGLAVDLVVPVPLHRVRERERGFNQAAAIARGVAESGCGTCLTTGLKRVRNTPTQTHLHVDERKANVAEAFAVDRAVSDRLQGATILVVDDVITTGATLGACATALKDAGAHHVIAASIALAVKQLDGDVMAGMSYRTTVPGDHSHDSQAPPS